ncbi:MAG: beta-galactosidase [Verrucomicrobiales bacterium]|nr:beta-galactosidase [Verrucomicrobiales bacterium]
MRFIVLIFLFVITLGRAEDEPGPFGIGSCHINNRSAKDNARWIPQMEAIGLKFYRSGQTGWSAVEPEQGKWHWQTLDEQLQYLSDHNFSYCGILIGNPGWNTADSRGSLPVNNLAGWSKYVSEIVEHCRGKVTHWEVWNEPPNFTGKDQTPADYAKIVVSAYNAAKKANPDCLIGLATKSVHINYLEQVIKAGAKDHFDYITLHPYEVLNGITDSSGTESVFMNIVPTVRKMLAAQNKAKQDVPIIFTELGCSVKKGADIQAYTLVKAYTMSIAQGVACVHWFEGRDGDSGPLGLIDRQGTPRPCYYALGEMIRYLGQRPVYKGWLLLNESQIGFVFEGAQAPVLVLWNKRRTDSEITFDKQVKIVNPLDGSVIETESYPLTTAPVFVLDVPDKLLKEAEANQGKSVPWGGDFSRSKSVSITMGENALENGLHTLSGDAVAEAVTGYGGSARAGNIPGGNLFVVDPGFLTYTSEPIEISAVVRRNEENVNSGFKLVYESVDGFKTAGGWYTVPDNKKWHTVKWQIDDPQFVRYWGYNFSLVSDGNKFNQYFIQKVTVTKRRE